VGTDPEKSKFQISFKYQFFNSDGPLVQNHPWAAGFHLGYTQTSFWDLQSASKPFEDTSYKPELFFLSPNFDTGWSRLRGLFLQTGLRHESNGRGGTDSRSTNTIYLKPMLVFYHESSMLGLLVAPKVWLYVDNDDETNPDLDHYRGYADLEIKAGKAEGLVFRSILGWAAEGGSVQLDLTYPLHRLFFGNIDLYFQVQYVNALAESLLYYQQRTRALRLGFAIIR
jgi:outer membrane phospholipase A